VICLDISKEILNEAVWHAGHDRDISFVLGDGLRLPFCDDAFDIAHTSHTLHHFSDGDAADIIREMSRVSRVGFVANDLVRSSIARMLITVITRMSTRNRLTLNDAPMSVARAFTPRDLSDIARRAGIADYTVHTHPFWRMALVGVSR
jgi:ubiquinone/menaquinone biosynthesis C-methylase UbiE